MAVFFVSLPIRRFRGRIIHGNSLPVPQSEYSFTETEFRAVGRENPLKEFPYIRTENRKNN
jgi:hypothetical protein